MTSLALSMKFGNIRNMILKNKGLVELTLKSSYKYNKENQMKNLNSSYTHSNINFNASIRSKLEKMLVMCESCNSDISHIYLTEDDAKHLMRNFPVLEHYQFRFNDLGIELVCPVVRKESY